MALHQKANSLINRGIDATRNGDGAETSAAFHHVQDIFERDAWFRWRYNIRFEAAMAEHWLKSGDHEKAREHVDRLMATATEHEVHKYIAVAHQLMAKVCIASGDLAAAEQRFDAALAELEKYPAPLVTWKVHAGRAQLKRQMGDADEAEKAAARASEIVDYIAANVSDQKLRDGFLNATAKMI